VKLGGVLARTLRHFFPEWRSWLSALRDPRDQARIVYTAPFLVTTGVLVFLLKLRARRQMKFALDTAAMLRNANGLAGTPAERVEHPDTLEYLMRRMAPSELSGLRLAMARRLVRMKCLDRWSLFGRFLVVIDGTGHLVFTERHCEHCLTQRRGDRTIYYHMVLEAKLVTEAGLVMSLATEFIENTDPAATKQDCELAAFYRLAERLKAAFPQMRMCLLLDSLYMAEPVLRTCRQMRWDWITTFKEGSMPERFAEAMSLMEMSPENRRVLTRDDTRQEYSWVNGLDVGEEKANILDCLETSPDGDAKRFVWATSLEIDRWNVAQIANRGGRLRWKIENEGFNEQKNGGYELEHAYSENETAAKNYYVLLQIAQLIELLVRMGSLLVRELGRGVRALFGGVRKFAEYLRESLRVCVIPAEAFEPGRIQIRFDTS
jgi:hypothetical protein